MTEKTWVKALGHSTRADGQKVEKVGILPYRVRRDTTEMEYLIYQPLPKKMEDRYDELPFQLARGTIEYQDANNLAAAKREATEELGIEAQHVKPIKGWRDCGAVMYGGGNKPAYPIHFFAVHLKKDARLPAQPEDANATMWATRSEITQMIEDGNFKKSYVPILNDLIDKIASKSVETSNTR
jgi:hypothetical protein